MLPRIPGPYRNALASTAITLPFAVLIATGDGVADDTAAFTALLADMQSTGRAGYIPQPEVKYLCSSMSIQFSGCVLFGDGRQQSIIEFTATGSASITIGATGTHVEAARFVGLGFRQASNVKQSLFDIVSANRPLMIDCRGDELYQFATWGNTGSATHCNQMEMNDCRWNLRYGHAHGLQVVAARGGLIMNNSYITGIWAKITNVTNNGSGLCRVSTSPEAHGLVTGDQGDFVGVRGATGVNGLARTVTVIDATTLDIDGSTFGGAYTAGSGSVQRAGCTAVVFEPNAVISRFDWAPIHNCAFQGFSYLFRANNYRVVSLHVTSCLMDGYRVAAFHFTADSTAGAAGSNIGWQNIQIQNNRCGEHDRPNGVFARFVATAVSFWDLKIEGNIIMACEDRDEDVIYIETDAAAGVDFGYNISVRNNQALVYDRIATASGRAFAKFVGEFHNLSVGGNVLDTGGTNPMGYVINMFAATSSTDTLRVGFDDVGRGLHASGSTYSGHPYQKSVTFDPASVASGATVFESGGVTFPNAKLGDVYEAAFSLNTQGLIFYAYCSVAGTVQCGVFNPGLGAIDLGSGTLTLTRRPRLADGF